MIDHVVPPSKGGRNNPENYQPLCAPCNNKKRDKICDLRPNGAHVSISQPREQVFKPYKPKPQKRRENCLRLTLPDELRARFQDLSERTGAPLAELTRRAMREYLERQP